MRCHRLPVVALPAAHIRVADMVARWAQFSKAELGWQEGFRYELPLELLTAQQGIAGQLWGRV
jgi:hypothetical protein